MRVSRLVAFALMAFAAVIVALPACSSNSAIERAVLCSEVSNSGEPKTVSDSFAPDIKAIYCSVKLASVSARSTVKAEWYLVRSDEAGVNPEMIGKGSVAAGTPYVVLAFTRAERLLPKGDYEVKLYYDDTFVQSARFSVKGEASPSPATLSDATMCTSIDQFNNTPVDKVDTFANDVGTIFCSFKVNNGEFDTPIKARWTYVSGELEGMNGKTIYEPTTKGERRQHIYFSLQAGAGKLLPVGEYAVTLFVEDREQVTLPFKVVKPAAISWPYVSEFSPFQFSGTDNRSIVLTQRFPADLKEIDVRARIYNAPPGTELTFQWAIVRSADATLLDKQVREDKLPVQGTGPIMIGLVATKEPFVKGVYSVTLLLNGQKLASMPFTVE